MNTCSSMKICCYFKHTRDKFHEHLMSLHTSTATKKKHCIPGLFWVFPNSPPVLFVVPNAEDPKPPGVAPNPGSDYRDNKIYTFIL